MLKTLEWDILNPDRLINLEIKTRGEQALFNLEIKKKSGSSINPEIHQSKVPSSDRLSNLRLLDSNKQTNKQAKYMYITSLRGRFAPIF